MTIYEAIGELSVLYERYSNGMGWRDGRYEEALQIAIEYLEDIEEPTGDYISRADAIEAVKETKPIVRSTERNWGKMIAEQHSKELVKALKALPSADAVQEAVPTVVRVTMSDGSQYYLEHECDAIQADAVQGWIPCSERLPEFPFISCDAHGNIHVPQGILTFEDSRGTWCIDDIYDKGKGMNYGNRIVAWMPLPKPYKGGDSE